MKDVALRAGVSISSVSHVINKTRKVETRTREAILAAIEELHYQPNTFARGLKGKSTKIIGVVIADIREDFFAEVVESIEFAASEQQYSVILCDSEDDLVKERFYLNMLIHKGVDGVIFSPVDSDSAYTFLVDSGIPFLQIDRQIPLLESDFVGIDNVRSSQEATEHLIRTGSRRIAFIGYDDKVSTQKLRHLGYRNALVKHDCLDGSRRLVIDYHQKITPDVIKEFFASHPELDGVVCGASSVCYETIVALDELRKRIPEDIRLASYDESKWFDYLRFPITVVSQPTQEIGRFAVNLITARIRRKKRKDFQNVTLETELIIR